MLEVIRQRSFTKAGDALWISQQGVSRAIKAIETELGITLFEREGKHISLTAEGRALLPYFEEIVSSYNALKAESYALKLRNLVTIGKQLNIYAIPLFDVVIRQVLSRELKSMGIDAITSRQVDLPEAIKQVSNKPQDALAIVVIRDTDIGDLQSTTSLCFTSLFEIDLTAWVSSKLVSPGKRSFTVDEIGNLPIAYFNDPYMASLINDVFGEKAVNNVVACSSNWNLLTQMAEESKAILITDSFTTSFFTKKDTDSFAVPIKMPFALHVGFLYSSDGSLKKEYFDYMDLMQKCIHTLYGENPPLP